MFKQINNPDPKYLAATDVLIGDMSDINYEFLLFNRPIILLANEWLKNNFPDIGIKTNLDGLDKAIKRSILKPEEFLKQREYWFKKTMYKPNEKSSKRLIEAAINCSGINKPYILLIHGDNDVLKTHLDPIYNFMRKENIDGDYVSFFNDTNLNSKDNLICVSAHTNLLCDIPFGYKVHIDHGLKGLGASADLSIVLNQYKKKNYFPKIDLHITEGEVSYEKTKKLLGPYKGRALMVGYPKSDTLLKLNSKKNRLSVCKELGFDPNKLIITYAPAGKYSYPYKPGASLSNKVLRTLHKIAKVNDNNFLIKLKTPKQPITKRIVNKIKKIF